MIAVLRTREWDYRLEREGLTGLQKDQSVHLEELAWKVLPWCQSTDTQNDLLSCLLSPSFPAFDSKHIISVKICFPAETEHRLQTIKSLWTFLFLHSTNNWGGMHLNKPKVISLF